MRRNNIQIIYTNDNGKWVPPTFFLQTPNALHDIEPKKKPVYEERLKDSTGDEERRRLSFAVHRTRYAWHILGSENVSTPVPSIEIEHALSSPWSVVSSLNYSRLFFFM